jgi:ribosomal RNA-processing protein 8
MLTKTKKRQSTPNPKPIAKRVDKKKDPLKKLEGARFRWLNEQLYTTTGDAALQLFQDDPASFHHYHTGFKVQVQQWPENPVDIFIRQLGQLSPSLVVADFGCGEAKLAATVKQTVHSFDLVAVNERVTACDVAHVPLAASSVDMVIFSLSLMGTNFLDFIKEAHRVLKPNGQLRIAEVKSRFHQGIDKFIQTLQKVFGFSCTFQDDANTMFILLHFVKKRLAVKEHRMEGGELLKPCVYKKR